MYWLAKDNGSAQGLARKEYTAVTSDDAQNTLPPDVPDEASCVIAEEVQSLTFSYFDGTSWQDSWDSTTLGPDGVTPIGPPVAIAIVLGLPAPGSSDLKSYRHVVAIPTANFFQQNSTTTGSTVDEHHQHGAVNHAHHSSHRRSLDPAPVSCSWPCWWSWYCCRWRRISSAI